MLNPHAAAAAAAAAAADDDDAVLRFKYGREFTVAVGGDM